MLGDEDDILCAGGADGAHPLVGIELGRIEDGGTGRAVAPLAIEKGVGGEVEDDAELEILPGDLIGSGSYVGGCLGIRRERGENDCCDDRG